MPEQHDRAVMPDPDPDEVPGEPEAARRRYLRDKARNNRRSLELTGLILVLFLIDFFWSSHTADNAAAGRAQIQAQAIAANERAIEAEQKAITAACDFWYPLTSLPVTIVAGQTKPTELSVKIIAGSRESYAGQCLDGGVHRPPLPPPDPSLVKWAHYYHLPVS